MNHFKVGQIAGELQEKNACVIEKETIEKRTPQEKGDEGNER